MRAADPLTDPPMRDDEDDGDIGEATLQDTIRGLPLWWHIAAWTVVGILIGGLILGPSLAYEFHH